MFVYKDKLFFYKFSLPSVLFEISCIQRYYTNARGQGRMVLIRTKKNPPPHETQGRGSCRCPGTSTPLSPPSHCHRFPVPVVILVSATSSHHPRPSCSPFSPSEQLLVMAVGGLVVVVVVVVMCRPCPHLPLVMVVVAQLEVLGRCLLFCCCFPCHCPPCRQGLAVVVWA